MINALKCSFFALLLATVMGSVSPVGSIADNNSSQYTLARDVSWASPKGFDLTMDIYTPTSGQNAYPVLVIFHGGGWLIRDKSIMDQMAQYVVSNGEYVVCNVNYRLLSDLDNTVTLNEVVNDAFGAMVWVKTHIGQYQGDPDLMAVTGDSAGGHLAAMVVNAGHKINSKGYSPDNLAFSPSYLPEGVSAEEIAQARGLSVQAAILSYGAFDLSGDPVAAFESWKNPFWYAAGVLPRGVFGDAYNVHTHPALYAGASPLHNIPDAQQRLLPPQLITVGTRDPVTTPASVRRYRKALTEAGQPSQYWEYEGKSHAFLDSGAGALLGANFAQNAPPALDIMLAFLNQIFYPDAQPRILSD